MPENLNYLLLYMLLCYILSIQKESILGQTQFTSLIVLFCCFYLYMDVKCCLHLQIKANVLSKSASLMLLICCNLKKNTL